MVPRTAVFTGLILAALFASPGIGRTRSDASTQAWLSGVLTKITRTDAQPKNRVRPGGTVTVRVRITSDGSLGGAAIDESSGKPALDDRALQAVRAAAPFAPPPAKILTLEGFTELSFPLQLGNP